MRTSFRSRNKSLAVVFLSSLFLLSACSSDSSAPVSYRVYPADGGPSIAEAVTAGESTLAKVRGTLEEQLYSMSWMESEHTPQLQPCSDPKAPAGYVTDTTSTWIGKVTSPKVITINWTEKVMPAVGRMLDREGYPAWNTSGLQTHESGTPYIIFYGVNGEELTLTRFQDGASLVLKTGCYRKNGTK